MDTINLNWEAIDRASAEREMIAVWMQDAGCIPEEITEALEAFDRHRDLDPDVREALLLDLWPPEMKAEWDGEVEQRDTEYKQHIALAAD